MKCFLYPDIGRVDEPLQLHMEGLIPREPVKMTLTMDHEEIGLWNASTITHADEQGRLIIGGQKKKESNILMKLIQNLRPIDGGLPQCSHSKEQLKPLTYYLDIKAAESLITESRTVTRLFKEDFVEEESVSAGPLSGTFYFPNIKKKLPGIIIFGGLLDTSPHELGALLASNGYGALVADYVDFQEERTSPVNMPLETIDHFIQWLQQHPLTAGKQIVVFGSSKGAELALLSASRNKAVSGVVAYSAPCHVVQCSTIQKPNIRWTENGRTLPSIKSGKITAFVEKVIRYYLRRKADSTADVFKQEVERYENKGKTEAHIQVEKINGPILLISGGSDGLWPSAWMGQKIVSRLEAAAFPYDVKHVTYPHAGHIFVQPYLPALPHTDAPVSLGGAPADNADAGERAWLETLEFLHHHFPPAKIPIYGARHSVSL
ncbi:Dienelactone hydrolase [Evansella caseinilytica]|uniref:Dienelactone hydrolase n=1 Tax=Evansella caseinilytica TaxID=1503961 RepID=A0A1H3R1L8_9BACI|nr:acyl-CoA thioester hydrolase/BAAT C-terminal domain-containing protein [Evansella caseinilytica]SDZ19496.1 Dienelactone hydrolase [Evansella caseinilytica]